MKKFLRKWLGIEDKKTTAKDGSDEAFYFGGGYEDEPSVERILWTDLEKDLFKEEIRGKIELVHQDVRVLYKELQSDIQRLNNKLVMIKPILKVDSPEAEQWIKDVLTKQTGLVRTQQTSIEEQLFKTRELEQSTNSQLGIMKERTENIGKKFDLVLKTLQEIQAVEIGKEQQENTAQM